MTKEEILAMEAGDELDILVARDIMEDDLEHQWEEGPSLTGVKYCVRCGVYDWMPDAKRPCSVMPYSIDIQAASQVLEATEGAWDIKTRYRPHPDDPPGTGGRRTYRAEVQTSNYDEVEDTLYNVNSFKSPWCWGLPEAISKAALLAKLEVKE